MKARPKSVDDAGSVLVEAMVAVAVIAMMLAVTYRGVGESVLRVRAAETARTASLIAQSRLALVGGEIPLAPGDASGVDGDFIWRVVIAPASRDPSANGRLLSVTAAVRDSRHPVDRAVLHTLREGATGPS
jgi:hypothetical protein